jgi:VRR-NUC domain
MRTTEAPIVAACLEYLTQVAGVLAWRSNNTGVFDPARKCFRSFRGLKGVSDILGILPGGRLLAVECKRPGGKPTAEQQAFLDEVNRRGGLAVCVHAVGELIDDLAGERDTDSG